MIITGKTAHERKLIIFEKLNDPESQIDKYSIDLTLDKVWTLRPKEGYPHWTKMIDPGHSRHVRVDPERQQYHIQEQTSNPALDGHNGYGLVDGEKKSNLEDGLYKLHAGAYLIKFNEHFGENSAEAGYVGHIAVHPEACRCDMHISAPVLQPGHGREIYATVQLLDYSFLFKNAKIAQVVFHQSKSMIESVEVGVSG